MGTVRFRWINSDGGGFAEVAEVVVNTTVRSFLENRLGVTIFSDYTIRYTPPGGASDVCSGEQVIQDGSRLSCTRNKIAGA